MEENKKIQVNNKILYTDTSPEFQPEGTSRFRLNAVPETNLGEQGNFSNELGNLAKIQLPNQGNIPNIIIGHIPILEDKTILFSVRADNSNSEIGIYNEKTEVYTTLINADCLNFKITNQIRGIFRIREGCNTNIYFTDFTNPWRVIDIDNLDQYKDNLGNWDCNSFKLFRDYNITNVNMEVFNTGGNTKVGMYQFTYQYLDDDFNPQPWNTPTNPIPIVKDSLNEYITLDGDVTNTDTNKSIQIQINNIDTRYSYVRIGLIVSNLGTGFNSNAYILEEVPVENNSITYLFSGLDPNKTQNTDLEAFTYLPPDYYTGKDLTQIDNSLILAYPKAREIDYVPFIQSALNIKSRYHIKDIFAEATGEDSFGNRYPNNYFYNKSLMRDEVYSFGIVYIFKDGTETPAFHIPGREANKLSNGNTINSIEYERIDLFPLSYNYHNRVPVLTGPVVDNAGNWDNCIYNSADPNINPNIIDDRQIVFRPDIGMVGTNTIERWKIFNTAIRTEVTQQPDNPGYFITKGELAYWESQDYSYPTTTDCNNQLIYGGLAGQKVRYHKMPDATLEPHFYGYNTQTNPTAQDFATIRPLNVEFFDINIPTEYIDQIQGYRIVRVERNEFNSSVLDKGITYHNTLKQDTSTNISHIQSYPFSKNLDIINSCVPTNMEIDTPLYIDIPERNSLSIHTPKTKLNKDGRADYIKIERTLYDTPILYLNRDFDKESYYYDEASDIEIKLEADDRRFFLNAIRYNKSTIPLPEGNNNLKLTNRRLTESAYIPANSSNNVSNILIENRTQLETYLALTQTDIPYSQVVNESVPLSFTQTALRQQIVNIPQLDTSNTFVFYTGNNEAVFSGAYYVGLKRYLPNQYNGLSQQTYTNPSNISTETSLLYSNGDTFISDWAFKKLVDFKATNDFNTDTNNADKLAIRNTVRFWCESTINMELRHSLDNFLVSEEEEPGEPGTPSVAPKKFNAINWYYPKNYSNSSRSLRYFLFPEEAWEKDLYGTVRNFYGYNKDFSIENTVRAFFPLPINYDYCNTCRVKFPHRLVNSNKAYQEERADNYRVFLPNNYRDIPGETGNINEVFVKDNKLFIHTTQSLWLQQVKPQQIKTDQATLYIGTGEFWEIPPNEVVNTVNGYAGCQHQFSTINTPFGYFWVSERERKIFLFNDKLEEISNRGLRNWFENNLPFNLDPIIANTLGTDNPSNPIGVGFTVAYDKRYRRIILSKKDYKPIPDTGVVFNGLINQWQLGKEVVNPYDEPTLFENKSWTISYHPDSQGFISWHSYLPYYMFNTQNSYYSFNNANVGWKHNIGKFHNYYDLPNPYIVEYTVPYQTTNLIDTINFYNKVYSESNGQWIELPNVTYDNVIVYNDNQVTPELDIIVTKGSTNPFQSVQNISNTEILATKAEEDWHISGFVDYSNLANEPLFTQDWTQIQNNYFIDKVVNPAKLDLNQSVFDLKQFRSKFINYRLIVSKDNLNNYKFVSKYDITGFRTSDR